MYLFEKMLSLFSLWNLERSDYDSDRAWLNLLEYLTEFKPTRNHFGINNALYIITRNTVILFKYDVLTRLHAVMGKLRELQKTSVYIFNIGVQ